MIKLRATGFSIRLWHLIVGGILGGALLGHLIFGNALFGNQVKVSGRIATHTPEFSSEFRVEHVMFSVLTHKFNVESKINQNMGRIDEQFLGWGRTFDFYDANGDRIAVAHQRVLAWSTTLDIFDGSGKTKLATLEKEIVQSIFKTFTRYRIVAADGSLIGESDKVDVFATKFFLYDKQRNLAMTLERNWINWPTDEWRVTINRDDINPVIAEAIAAYKSAADADK